MWQSWLYGGRQRGSVSAERDGFARPFAEQVSSEAGVAAQRQRGKFTVRDHLGRDEE